MKKYLILFFALFCFSTINFSQVNEGSQVQEQTSRLGKISVYDSQGNRYGGILFETISKNGITYKVYILERNAYYYVEKNIHFSKTELLRWQRGEKHINKVLIYKNRCVYNKEKFYFDLDYAISQASH